jgi:hypothetical protein
MAAVSEVAEGWARLDLAAAAGLDANGVLERLGSSDHGLSPEEASRRLAAVGTNAVLSHGARPLQVLWRRTGTELRTRG